MSVRSLHGLFLLIVCLAARSSALFAQADPRTLPLLPPTAFSGLSMGAFYYDYPDGAGGTLSYGGGAMGVSEDGRYLYVSCQTDDHGIAKLEIPPDGGVARIVAPCLGPNRTELRKLHPDPTATKPQIGGVLEQGGRMVVTGFISYDATGGTVASHWGGPSLGQLSGPFIGTVPPGLVKSQMGPIPPEWRQALGGPAFSTAGYTSIISRASYGAAFSVFDPAAVTRNGFPMQMLLGCPDQIPSCRTWTSWGPSSNGFEGTELAGGTFIVPGTRTLVSIEREGSGGECYGYTTTNPALHGQPYPSPEGVRYCYSLSDPLNQKGNKAYPYRLVAKLYDLADLVDVRLGVKQPWDIKQYATADMPGSSPSEFITSGAFNPVRNEYYLLRIAAGNLVTVHVYRFGGGGGGSGSTVPSAPANFRGVVSGSTLTLNWSPSAGATTYLADAGTAPGASNVAAGVSLGAGTGFVATAVPNGGYYLRLRATGPGGTSVPSNEVFVAVGGGGGSGAIAPGPPDGFRASVNGSVVTFTWYPPEDGSPPTGYVFDAGSAPGLANLAANIALPNVTSLAIPGVPAGTYYVRVRATNSAGTGPPGSEARVVVR